MAIEYTALLFCIQEVPGSHLGFNIGYQDYAFPQAVENLR
jgi:hypothetical protein